MNDKSVDSASSRLGPILALSYLYVPFLLFDLGWIRPAWAIPIAVVSLAGFVLACSRMPKVWVPEATSANIGRAAACAVILAVWVTWSGIGGYVWGEVDHLERNTVIRMLVEHRWPLYSMDTPGLPPDAEPSIMSYYVGFYLPPAAIGRVTTLRGGFFALWFQAFFGVCLAYYLVCAKLKRLMVWPVLVFILFSGADSIGVLLRGLHHPGVIPFWSPTANFEQWSAYNYSCQTTQLFWVYNQAIPAWIATAMLVCGLPASVMLFVASCLMINATFAFLAMCFLAPVFAWTALPKGRDGEMFFGKTKRWAGSFLTVPNFIGPVTIGIPCYLYLSDNTAGSHFYLHFHWTYPLFVFLEAIVLLMPLYRKLRRDIVFWVVFAALMLLPLGNIGGNAGDFYTRTSIPFLFIILCWYVETLHKSASDGKWMEVAMLSFVLLLGIPTPLHEMSRTVVRTRQIPDLKEYWEKHNAPESKVMLYGPYYGAAPIKGSGFCEFLAKRPKERTATSQSKNKQ